MKFVKSGLKNRHKETPFRKRFASVFWLNKQRKQPKNAMSKLPFGGIFLQENGKNVLSREYYFFLNKTIFFRLGFSLHV
jgi:hypothetical protein